jgi:hypothetical protein
MDKPLELVGIIISFIHSFSSLSRDRIKAYSKASIPLSAI